MAKLRVGVIFGGRSGEHEVSLVSAKAVMAGLDRRKYDVIPIAITRQGQWLLGSKGQLPQAVIEQGRPTMLAPQPRRAGAWKLASASAAAAPRLDVVLPILHGPYGEDGTIQGLLELADIPYVGSGVLGSAAAMDKDVMKRLFLQAGLPVGPYRVLRRRAFEQQPKKAIAELERALPYPMFVKPANLGSSVGISKVHRRAELTPALELAAGYDPKIIIEQGIDARELECSVLGNGDAEASLPGEVIAGREFYDYDAKYADTGSRTLIPAPIGARRTRQLQKLALQAFQATDCAGLARVDFFLDRVHGQLLVNEINSMPGFTPISMYPKLWAASGLPFPALLDRLIALALERARERQARPPRR